MPMPDLVILDAEMPLLRGDRRYGSFGTDRGKEVAVLLTSVRSEEELALLVTSSGADGYIRKPIHSPDIMQKVQGVQS